MASMIEENPEGKKPPDALAVELAKAIKTMGVVLPNTTTVTPEKLARLALMEVQQTPKLRECLPDTLVHSVVQAAALGLHVGRMLGEGYLVPYFDTKVRHALVCQLIPGYKGLIKLAVQGLTVLDIDTRLVYKEDKFTPHYGTDERIEHEPVFDAPRNDEDIIGGYMLAYIRGRERPKFVYMTRAEVEKRRSKSAAKDGGPWKDWYPEQFSKTLVRNGIRTLPASSDSDAFQRLQAAVELDNRFDTGEVLNFNDYLDTEATKSEAVRGRTQARIEQLREQHQQTKQLGEGAAQPIEMKHGEKQEATRR